MLTIWVHVVTGHLWGGETLLEGVCTVAVLIHGDQLLLWRGQWREGVHYPFHPIGHHLCKTDKAVTGKSTSITCFFVVAMRPWKGGIECTSTVAKNKFYIDGNAFSTVEGSPSETAAFGSLSGKWDPQSLWPCDWSPYPCAFLYSGEAS